MKKHFKISLLLAIAAIAMPKGIFARENMGSAVVHKGGSGNNVSASCNTSSAKTDLDINNIRTKILTSGDMWWDLVAGKYEVPKGSGKNSIFAGALWIGGIDGAGNIKLAAMTYRQTGDDFWPGAINTQTGSIDVAGCQYYDRHWKVSKQDVLSFINGGAPTKDIKEWPGNGRPAYYEDNNLAPFFDKDSDGVYKASAGDYPYYNFSGDYTNGECNDYIFGDQTLWWVFNDVGNVHTESLGDQIGLEIRAQAFAFQTNDEINNMTFYKYKIINRSSFILDSTYFGVWVDPDLGNYNDDYVGCDVKLGLGFVYNGDEDDDGGTGYGLNPPSLGVDFFQGPLADPFDGIDNNLNGDTDEVGEQIIMSKFLYYNNVNCTPNGNPCGVTHFYNYLKGIWGNGQVMTYGGDGMNAANPPCNYMFPGTSDPAHQGPSDNWTEATAGNAPGDRRFLQSAGKFTLTPGAVNYITTGVVWARSTSGGVQGGINLMKTADIKAQQIFDNCFKVIDGPDAPDLTIRELNKQLIVTIVDYNTPKRELYNEIDPTIPQSIPNDTGGLDILTDAERSYKFEGYMIFQLSDAQVTAADLYNPDKARLILQCDVKNGVGAIVNNTWSEDLNYWVPKSEVIYSSTPDQGITHSIIVTKDLFASGNSALVNSKDYYYIAVSYAYNNFRPFVATPTVSPNYTQGKPFLQGRLNIKTYAATPHPSEVENNGQQFGASVGSSPVVQRIEGQGNGGNIIEMNQTNVNEAIAGPYYRSYNPFYLVNKGPLSMTVYDPVKIKSGNFELKFNGVADSSIWTLKNLLTNQIDVAERGLSVVNQQVFKDYGLVSTIYQVPDPGTPTYKNNGFLEATQTGSSIVQFMADNDANDAMNWIRPGDYNSGTLDPDSVYEGVLGGTWAPFKLMNNKTSEFSPKWGNTLLDVATSGLSLARLASIDFVITSDKSQWTRSPVFEVCNTPANTQPSGVGKFELRKSASLDKNFNPANVTDGPSDDENAANFVGSTGMSWFPGYAVNIETGERLNIAFGENSSLDANMKFDPSNVLYKDNLVDSPRIGNMQYIYVFGHNRDSSIDVPRYDYGRFIHDILLTPGSNGNKKNVFKDCMWGAIPLLANGKDWNSFYAGKYGTMKVRLRVAKGYKTYSTTKEQFSNETLLPNTTYKVLVDTITYNGTKYSAGKTFTTDGSTLTFSGTGAGFGGGTVINLSDTKNGTNPMYNFNTDALANVINDTEVAKNALDLINVVPNPYYAYSAYEKNQYESIVKITNLPAKCTVSILTLNGTLIYRIKRDIANNPASGAPDNSQGGTVNDGNLETSEKWDLKNTKGIAVSSGVFLIHVEAPGLGERTLKFFCIQRPTDVSIF